MKDVATGEMMKFYADCWIAVDRGNYQLYQELPAIRAGLSTSPGENHIEEITGGLMWTNRDRILASFVYW